MPRPGSKEIRDPLTRSNRSSPRWSICLILILVNTATSGLQLTVACSYLSLAHLGKNPPLHISQAYLAAFGKQCPTPKLPLKDQNNLPKNRAHAPPSLESTEGSTSSLIDVDSPHISSVSSEFESQAVQTRTQAERMEREAEDKARATSQKASEAGNEASQKASEASSKASGESKKFTEYASEKGEAFGKEAKDEYEKLKKSTSKGYREGKEGAKDKGSELSRNRDNPVVIGNAVVIALVSAGLGFGAYKKYTQGELDWKLAGATAAV
ncbi:MAG: hypothetical protein Q9190_004379, partial [Brigantiaea leucoxantha]